MRKLLFLIPVFLLLVCAGPVMAQVVGVGANEQAQTPKERAEAATKTALEKVVKFGQALNYQSLGHMSAYAGREPNRSMKTKLNLMDSFERLENENTCNLIHKIMETTVIWNPTNFRIVNAADQKFYYWDAEFTDEKMKTKVYSVLFVELAGEMCFARIEKKGTLKQQ